MKFQPEGLQPRSEFGKKKLIGLLRQEDSWQNEGKQREKEEEPPQVSSQNLTKLPLFTSTFTDRRKSEYTREMNFHKFNHEAGS